MVNLPQRPPRGAVVEPPRTLLEWIATAALVLTQVRWHSPVVPGVPVAVLGMGAVACVGGARAGMSIPPLPTAVLIVSGSAAVWGATSPTAALQWFLLLVAGFAFAQLLPAGSTARVVPSAVLLGGVLSSLAVLWQSSGGTSITGEPVSQTYNGLTEYYLQAAYFSALGLVAAVFGVVQSGSRRVTAGMGAAAAVCGLAVLAGGSRNAVLISVVGSVAAIRVLRHQRRGRRSSLVLVAGAIATAVIALRLGFSDVVLDRLSESSAGAYSHGDLRRRWLQALAWDVVSAHPLGLGWDAFPTFSTHAFGEAIRSTHSLYLSLPLDLGWAGAGAFLYLLCRPALGRTDRDPALPLYRGLVLAMAAHGLSDSIHVFPPAILFHAAFTAMGWEAVRRSRAAARDRRGPLPAQVTGASMPSVGEPRLERSG